MILNAINKPNNIERKFNIQTYTRNCELLSSSETKKQTILRKMFLKFLRQYKMYFIET